MAERPPDAGRRAFLTGTGKASATMRPPWAGRESEFVESCVCCGACVAACPERVLRIGAGGYPEIDFAETGCTLCAACVDSCQSKALNSNARPRPWDRVATIGGACLAVQGVHCQSCRDACPEQAIRFLPERAVPRPRVGTDRCTACGACVSACPVAAIAILPNIASAS